MENIKFEDTLRELGKITNNLQSGNLDLDESINQYKKAMEYIKVCTKRLEEAKQEVVQITKDFEEVKFDDIND